MSSSPKSPTSPTSPTSPRGFAFTNPFERQSASLKTASIDAVTAYEPLLSTTTSATPTESSSSSYTTSSSSSPSGSGWRTRAASIFQSISSSSSIGPDRSADRNLNSGLGLGVGPGAIQLKTDLQRERLPSVAGPRRPSYVPRYAAAAHMTSMSGRSMVVGSKAEAEEKLRRDSRMASVAFGRGERLQGMPMGSREEGGMSTGIAAGVGSGED